MPKEKVLSEFVERMITDKGGEMTVEQRTQLAGSLSEKLQEQIEDVGIYLFDEPVGGRGMERLREQGFTAHCIGLSPAAERIRVEGKTVVEWVWEAFHGKTGRIGLGFLEKE